MITDRLELINRIHISTAGTSSGIGPKMSKYRPAKKQQTKLEKLNSTRALGTIKEGLEKTVLGTIQEIGQHTLIQEKVNFIDKGLDRSTTSSRISPPNGDGVDPMIVADKRAGEMLEDFRVLLADDNLQRRVLAQFFKANPTLIGTEGSLQEKMAPLQELAAELGCGLQKTMDILNLNSNAYPTGSKIHAKPSKPKGLSREDRIALAKVTEQAEIQAIKLTAIADWLDAGGGPGLKYQFHSDLLHRATPEQINNKIDKIYLEACYEIMQGAAEGTADSRESTKLTRL